MAQKQTYAYNNLVYYSTDITNHCDRMDNLINGARKIDYQYWTLKLASYITPYKEQLKFLA